MHGNCKCKHHWIPRILAVLAWIAGIAFFWSGLKGVAVWGYDPLFYAWSVVVLSLLAWSCNYCGCCGRGMMSSKIEDDKIMCGHEGGCKCEDCDKCC